MINFENNDSNSSSARSNFIIYYTPINRGTSENCSRGRENFLARVLTMGFASASSASASALQLNAIIVYDNLTPCLPFSSLAYKLFTS